MSRNALYAWVLLAIGALVMATLIPWVILHNQTKEIERLARVAVCVSLAEQERFHASEGLKRLDLRRGCFGLTGPQIIKKFQDDGQDLNNVRLNK